MRLQEKVVLVTGSATGIGRAIAARVVAEGGRVVVHGLEAELVAKVVERLNTAGGEVAGRTGPTAVGHVAEHNNEGRPGRVVSLPIHPVSRLDGRSTHDDVIPTGDLHHTRA